MINEQYLSQVGNNLRGAIEKAFEQTNADLTKLKANLTPEQLKQLENNKDTFKESLNALENIKNLAHDFDI
jgi:hypothetical protein